MATKWASAALLDGGSDRLRTLAATTNRIMMHLVKAYTAGDSYATVTGTNSIGSVAMVPGDFVQSGAAGAARVTTVAAKTIASLSAGSGASPDLAVVLVDSTGSTVEFVTDETTNQVCTAGNPFNVPSFTITFGQPT